MKRLSLSYKNRLAATSPVDICVKKDTKYVKIVTNIYDMIFKDPFKPLLPMVVRFGLYFALNNAVK